MHVVICITNCCSDADSADPSGQHSSLWKYLSLVNQEFAEHWLEI